MSNLKRYNLLNSWLQSAARYQHTLSIAQAEPHNNIVIHECISAWVFLLEDLLQGYPEAAKNRRILNWLRATYLNDFQDVVSLCKCAYTLLIDDSTSKEMSYDNFKGYLAQSVPGFRAMELFLSPISSVLSTYLPLKVLVNNQCFSTQGVHLLEVLAQFFSFPLKLTFIHMGLEEKALSDYLKTEIETASWHINIDNHELCTHVKSILTIWLKDFDYDGLNCQHGPGSVADTKDKSLMSKYLHIKTDKFLSIVMRVDYDGPDKLEQQIPFGISKSPLTRCSKLVFVPKNVTKMRSISMEPTTLQFVQQGVQIALRAYIDKHPYLSNIIKLGNQMQNRSFAYEGSITDMYATIDLSHASDSVNWECVKYVFSGVPKLLKWLIATRSTHTRTPIGERLFLKKFAPMGSSLCFPIETLLFAAIAQCSIERSRKYLQTHLRYSQQKTYGLNNCFTVYGDDIIVPSYSAEQCICDLKLLGFTPNEDKTYVSGAFKESCGGNYYCGHDVTAIKFNPPWSTKYKQLVDPETYNSLASLANLANEHSYTFLRLYCIKRILGAGLYPLFSDTNTASPQIFSLQPTNFHLKMKMRKVRSEDGRVLMQRKLGTYTGIKSILQKDAIESVAKDNRVSQSTIRKLIVKLRYFMHLRTVKSTSLIEYNLNCEMLDTKAPYPNSLGLEKTLINGNTLMFQSDAFIDEASILPSTVVFNHCVVEL